MRIEKDDSRHEGIFLIMGCRAWGRGYIWVILTEKCFSFGRSLHREVLSDSSPLRIKKKKCHWDRSLCTLRSLRLLNGLGSDGRRKSGEPGRSVWQPVLPSWSNLIRNANWLKRVGRPRNTRRMKTCDPQTQRKVPCKKMVMFSVEVQKHYLPCKNCVGFFVFVFAVMLIFHLNCGGVPEREHLGMVPNRWAALRILWSIFRAHLRGEKEREKKKKSNLTMKRSTNFCGYFNHAQLAVLSEILLEWAS